MTRPVPLAHATIYWNPRPDGDGRVVVWDQRLPYEPPGPRLSCTTGACWAYWDRLKPADQLLRLLAEAFSMMARDGIKFEDVHRAFLVVPEYREALSLEDAEVLR